MLSLRIVFAGIVDTEDLPLDSESTPVLLVTRLSGRACGDRIRILRKRLGLTRKSVANLASISYYTASRAEVEPEKVSLRHLTAICNVLCHHLAVSSGYGALNIETLKALRQLIPSVFAAEGFAAPIGDVSFPSKTLDAPTVAIGFQRDDSRANQIDLLIVTALTEEAQVVAAALDHLARPIGIEGPIRTYEHRVGIGVTIRIATASAHMMGAVGMGVFVGPLLRDLRPKSAALIGIAAAADTSAVQLGDVPVASQVLSYDDIAVQNGTLTFRTEGFQVDPVTMLAVGRIRTSKDTYVPWQQCCQSTIIEIVPTLNLLRRVQITPPEIFGPPHLIVGVTAGGPLLLRDGDFRDALRNLPEFPQHAAIKLTSPVHPKLVSVEMESHGFMRAALQYSIPASVLKGISDVGDIQKGELEKKTGGFFRAYACCNAIVAALHVLRVP